MFGFGKKRFLGIDIGSSSIKIAELVVKKNKPTLSNYTVVNIESLKQGSDGITFNENLAEYLKKIIDKGKFTKKNVYVSIPSFAGLITLIEYPAMPLDELGQSIEYEAQKYVPLPLSEVSFAWDVVGESVKDQTELKQADQLEKKDTAPAGKKLQVLLAAAPKKNIEKYQNLMNQAGLSLNAIEIESFSLVRCLVGKDPGKFVIVDIGARVCNIILVENGEIKINRNIDAGGSYITKEIAQNMNINEERAEIIKVSGEDILGSQSNLSLSTFGIIANEVKRVLLAYYKDVKNISLNGIILAGGSANILNIDIYFSQAFGMKALIGDPLSRVECDENIKHKIGEIRARLAVSIGLALKGIDSKKVAQKNKFLNIKIFNSKPAI